MPVIRLLEAGPNDGLEFKVPTLPQVWEMPDLSELRATMFPIPKTRRYIQIGWLPQMGMSVNATGFMTQRQFDETQGYYAAEGRQEAAIMYLREDQAPKMSRRV